MAPRHAKKNKKLKSKDKSRGKPRPKKEPAGPSSDVVTENSNTDPHNHEEKHPFVMPQRSVSETCDFIADLSESILEDPTSAFFSQKQKDASASDEHRQPSKMQQLLYLANANKNRSSTNLSAQAAHREEQNRQHIASLAVLSLLAIFQDVLPSYRIRLPTAQEMAVRVSKDTKRLWGYERNLLHHYQQYLQLLEKTWNGSSDSSKKKTPLQVTCLLCQCELLQKAFYFNFRSNLLTFCIRHMSFSTQDDDSCVVVSNACCQAVETVFQKDATGQVALEAARQVAKRLRNHHANNNNSKTAARVLTTFLALPLRVHADEAVAAQMASRANAKKRKQQRSDGELTSIQEELKESTATVDKTVLARCQAETLEAITLTYFRIIKNASAEAAASDNASSNNNSKQKLSSQQAILSAALEGLAKFAHLINIDTVMDLLAVLKDLLRASTNGVNQLPVEAALNCILTAFATLQGPGKELKIDVKEYITPLYSQLPRLIDNCHCNATTINLALKCLDLALIQRREYSSVRVAAFFKQIVTVALHTASVAPASAVALLATARHLLQRYPSVLQQLLENEQDVITAGQYDATQHDPEHCNPFATSAWELALLRFHHDTHHVVPQAVGAAQAKPLQLPLESPQRLRAAAAQRSETIAIEFVRNKRKHPLEAKESSNSNGKKKQRRQVRFVTPRARQLRIIQEE